MSWSEELRRREILNIKNEIRKEIHEYKQLQLEYHGKALPDWEIVKNAERIIELQHRLIVKLS